MVSSWLHRLASASRISPREEVMRKKLLRLLWVAPVAMLLFAGSAAAQSTGTIVGVVNDAATGKPVAGALVIATSQGPPGRADRGDRRPGPVHPHGAAARPLQARRPAPGLQARRAHRHRPPRRLHPARQPRPGARGGADGGAGREDRHCTRGEHRLGRGRHHRLEGVPGHRPDHPRLRGQVPSSPPPPCGTTVRRQLRRRDLAREQLHPRRPPRRRPELRHPGHEPAHQLRRPDRRQDRRRSCPSTATPRAASSTR